MTPDEKQLLTGLFDRIRAADTGPRDAEAESFIAEATRQNPGATYLLAQAVLIQEQALAAANQKLQELQAQVNNQMQGSGSFLGGIGKSLFGQQPPPRAPQQAYAPQPTYAPPPPPVYAPPPAPGPWGAAAPSSGGFLSGALHTAAGVAGGVLLADGIRSLFSGNHGMMSNFAGPAFGATPGSETIVNNYYGDSQSQHAADVQQDQDQDQDMAQDAADDSSDYSSDFGSDDT